MPTPSNLIGVDQMYSTILILFISAWEWVFMAN